jgi:outer membrane receptor protein involved in Fe transport
VNPSGNPFRTGERLTNQQTTPSEFFTASGQWTRAFGGISVLAGVEGRWTDATVQEYKFTCPTSKQTATGCTGYLETPPPSPKPGGTETNTGVYGRVSFAPVENVTVVVGARGDMWNSEPNDPAQANHDANFFSPRVSAGWRLSDMISLHGAGYRSSRTPTLNELYRGFRVGTIDTFANPALDPETLTGGEGGALFTIHSVSARVTGFFNQLDDAITNVTCSPTPCSPTLSGATVRQRQNTQTLRARGVEVEANYRPSARLTFSGVVVGTWANFEHTPEQPIIEGNRVPQVPKFQLGGSVIYSHPIGFTGAVQARAFGDQFDDDQNLYLLDKYGVVDLTASQQIVREVNVFVAVENLFDKEYDTGKTPVANSTLVVRTVGWPRTARVGIRVFLP